MKLATTTADFSSYTRSQILAMEYIRLAGFKYVDYSFGIDYSDKSGIFGSDPEGHIESVLKKADELGVKLIQSHAQMGRPLADPDGSFLRDTAKCVEACGKMGIPNVVVHSGYLPDISKEECFERNKQFFMPLLELGEKYNVDVLVENFNKMTVPNVYWIDNAPDLLAMVEYVDHPRFHAVWDAGHANMQEMPQDEALRLLGKQVRALHIQDNMGGTYDSHVAPFFGTLNLDSLMHGLLDIGYDGYFTFEACGILLGGGGRRKYEADTRLLSAPLSLRIKAEEFLYEIGKTTLEAYGCFEE